MWRLDPKDTHEYISSLDASLKACPVVAIAAAIAYLEDQDYRLADKAIKATRFHDAMKEGGWLFHEQTVSLALLSGIINIHRTFEFAGLIQLLADVESIYMNPGMPSVAQSSLYT